MRDSGGKTEATGLRVQVQLHFTCDFTNAYNSITGSNSESVRAYIWGPQAPVWAVEGLMGRILIKLLFSGQSGYGG